MVCSPPQSKILATPETVTKRYVSNNNSMHHYKISESLKKQRKQKTIDNRVIRNLVKQQRLDMRLTIAIAIAIAK